MVIGHINGKEDSLRAELACPADGHGRVYPVDAGLIAGGRYDGSCAGADDDRFSLEFRIPGHLAGGIEGIHVDMQYCAPGLVVSPVLLGGCQPWCSTHGSMIGKV